MEFLKKCDYKGWEVRGKHTSYSGRKKLPDVKSTEDFVAVLSQNRSRLARYHPHTRCCDVNGPRGCIHTSLGLHLTERRIDIHGQCPSISRYFYRLRYLRFLVIPYPPRVYLFSYLRYKSKSQFNSYRCFSFTSKSAYQKIDVKPDF